MPKQSKKAADTQIGGQHYKGLGYQPFHLALDCKGSPAFIKCAKYLTREKNDRKENLRKAYHCLQLEHEYFGNGKYQLPGRGLGLRMRADRLEMYEEYISKFCSQFKSGSVYKTILMCIADRNYPKAKETLTKFVRYGRWEEI